MDGYNSQGAMNKLAAALSVTSDRGPGAGGCGPGAGGCRDARGWIKHGEPCIL